MSEPTDEQVAVLAEAMTASLYADMPTDYDSEQRRAQHRVHAITARDILAALPAAWRLTRDAPSAERHIHECPCGVPVMEEQVGHWQQGAIETLREALIGLYPYWYDHEAARRAGHGGGVRCRSCGATAIGPGLPEHDPGGCPVGRAEDLLARVNDR